MSNGREATPPIFSAAWIDDPYPSYRHHLSGPALQLIHEQHRIWGVFRYAECAALYRSPLLSSARPAESLVRVAEVERQEFHGLIGHMQTWLLLRDPPVHSELRRALNRGFSPGVVERLRDGVERIVSQLLAPLQTGCEIDIVRDIAYLLPVRVISHLLGIPQSAHDRCIALTNDLANWFGSVARSPDLARIAQSAVLELVGIFEAVVADRKHDPGGNEAEGLLLDLLLDIAQDSRLSPDDLYAQCVMLLFAGHETTRHWIGNTMHTLLAHPEALRAVQSDAALVRAAMEEVLRFESPVKMTARTALSDLTHDGVTVPKGHTVAFFMAAAHRDPDQFVDPDRFDIHRSHNRHFAFGGDAHVCLGSTLARLEGQTVVRELLARYPGMQRSRPGVEWLPVMAFRGVRELPVRL